MVSAGWMQHKLHNSWMALQVGSVFALAKQASGVLKLVPRLLPSVLQPFPLKTTTTSAITAVCMHVFAECLCVCVSVCLCVDLCVSVCLCVCMSVGLCVSVCLSVSLCVCLCVCARACVCLWACLYHLCIGRSWWWSSSSSLWWPWWP